MNTYEGRQYRRFATWSPAFGCRVVRLSMSDQRGGEHWAHVPLNGRGKENREAEEAALQAIHEHVRKGSDPGEVLVGDHVLTDGGLA